MKYTKEEAEKLGFTHAETINGITYYLNTNVDPFYTDKDLISYFGAIPVDIEFEEDKEYYVGYPKRDHVSDVLNEWSDIYDVDSPFVLSWSDLLKEPF